MELLPIGRKLSSCYKLFTFENKYLLRQSQASAFQLRTYAARKGYREKARKSKVKTVIQKQGWIPHNLRKKDGQADILVKPTLELNKKQALDDVYVARFYAWRVFDFKEAVECHRETHHPTIYNVPNAPVNVFIELDMRTERPTRFVEKFRKMAKLPNFFEQDGLQERTILAFCKTPEQKADAMDAGANLVGGVEIIKEIEKGKVVLPDFRFVVAHPSILPEMITIRGLLKKRFPNVKTGTLSPNIGELVAQFKNGVEYACLKNDNIPEFGWINTCIGRLNMETDKLEENFRVLLQDINTNRSKRKGPFISRVLMSSPPSVEKLKLNLEPYVEDEAVVDDDSSDDDEPVTAKAKI